MARPRKTTTETQDNPAPRKGRKSWKPANLIDIHGKEDGFRYRILSKDSQNLAKKLAEGWELVNNISESGETNEAPKPITGGSSLTSVREGHDWVLARIPEEDAKLRDEYYQQLTDRRTRAITKDLKNKVLEENTTAHGSITMKHGSEVNVIN